VSQESRARIRHGRLGAAVLVAAVLGLAGCGGGSSSSSSGGGGSNAATSSGLPTDYPLPGADLQNTRYVGGPIDSSNVSTLTKAWSVPIKAQGSFGTYATTPIILDGVVYTQDIDSNVYAIDLKSGQMKWYKSYNSPSVGPNGVTVDDGVVYGNTGDSTFAIQASTGEQLWIKKLTRNANEGIDMAPGIHDGTLYVSTVPGNNAGFYKGNGQAILWAMDAKTGDVKWKWDEVPSNLWSDKYTDINSGGGQWDPPSFDSNGDVYIGVSNPAPFPGTKDLPQGSSHPGPNLYTDSIVKLDHETGKLDWYYQLTPHDINDWDMQNSPMLTTVNGKPAVIDGGKAGIVVAVDQDTGKLLWKTPVGKHNGHDDDGQLTIDGPSSTLASPRTVFPGILGGIESQLATNGKMTYAAVNDLSTTFNDKTGAAALGDFSKGTGEMVAIDQNTGKVAWQHKFTSSPYGAATLSNDVVWTTTFDGTVWALDANSGYVLWSAKLPAGTNTPVAVGGGAMITAGSFPLAKTQKAEIVAYTLPAS